MGSDEAFPLSLRTGLPELDHLELAVRESRPSPGRWPVFSDIVVLGPGRVGLLQGETRCSHTHEEKTSRDVLALAREWLGRAPGDIVLCARELNRVLFDSAAPGAFVPLFLGVYEDDTRSLTYVNSGHEPPVIRRCDGATEVLVEGGVPLAMMEEFPFESGRVRLGTGDLLVLIADFMAYGIMRPKSVAQLMNEPDARDVIESTTRALVDTSPERVIQALLEQVSTLRRGDPVDDVELIVARAR